MNTFVVLLLQESMAQQGAGKHEQCRRYMTLFVVNDGIIKSIRTLTLIIRPMITFDLDKPWDRIPQEVTWTQALP
jgi:hypothetical protein